MPETGDCYEVAQRAESDAEDSFYNVYGFKITAGTCTEAELLTSLATLMTAAYDELATSLSDTVSLQEGIVNKVVWSGTQWVVDHLVGLIYPTTTFTGTAAALPNQVAALASWPTSSPRRRARKYTFPLTEAAQDDGYLTGGALAELAAFAAELLGTKTASGADYKFNLLCSDGVARGFTGYVADALLSTQRRRKPGVGV